MQSKDLRVEACVLPCGSAPRALRLPPVVERLALRRCKAGLAMQHAVGCRLPGNIARQSLRLCKAVLVPS